MKLSAEVAKLLKLDPEKASQEDFDKAVQELAAKKGTATGPDPETVKAQVRQEMAAQREEIRKEVHEELRKESAAKDRKAKVERLLAQATSEGKVVADNREGLEALAAADPDAFEKVLPGLAVHAPVKSWFTPAREKASAKVPVSALSDPAVSREVAERATALAAEKQIPYTEALNSLVTA